MRIFAEIMEAADAARENFIINKNDLPEFVRNKIQPFAGGGSSPVDFTYNFVETVYANRADLPAETLDIAAGVAHLYNQKGYYGRLNGRAADMETVLLRESGADEPSDGWPDAANDPAPAEGFSPVAAPAPGAPGAPPVPPAPGGGA